MSLDCLISKLYWSYNCHCTGQSPQGRQHTNGDLVKSDNEGPPLVLSSCPHPMRQVVRYIKRLPCMYINLNQPKGMYLYW